VTEPKHRTVAKESAAPASPVLTVFTSHWLAMVGVGLIITAIIMWACLLPSQVRGGKENPYLGLATMVVGGVLVLGAVLTPIGLFFGRRRLARRVEVALQEKKTPWRRLLLFLLVTSLFNLAIASQATLHAVHTMESRQFCGSCHVMTPESRAFTEGAHAGILCVDCHVGSGARGFVKSKLAGTRQLVSVMRDTVHMPIESAIESGRMVPSAETCEQCHWTERPADARLKLIQRYADDAENTPETTLLTMNIGGSRMGGIHGAHNAKEVEIRFVATDKKRQEIPWVEYKNSATGETRTYVKKDVDPATYESLPRITMQCFDCHNRPAHTFLMPDRAVDRALMLGRMSLSLPFLKKTAVDVLSANYASSAAAATEIPKALAAYYESDHPDVARARAADIKTAGEVVADIYSRNVFPEFKVTWGTYPDNRGHEEFPGCFRCHDGGHSTSTGETITNNCFKCHHPAAVSETQPEVLELLGVDKLLKKLQDK
jgi:hypothetical protein